MKSLYTSLLSSFLLAGMLAFSIPLQAAEGAVDANVERVAQSVEKVAETVSKSVSEAQLAGTELAFDRMEGYFTAAQGVIEKYGGDVAALGLNALRIDAITHIAPNLVGMIILLTIAFCGYKLLPTVIEKDPKYNTPLIIVPWIMMIAGGVGGVVNLALLFNIWAWAGIFYPELWAIHKFILN